MAKKLTDKQKAFCDEYLVDLNATQAARTKLERISRPIHHTGVTGVVGFLCNQDPIFAAYRYLASASEVSAVWQVDRPYFNSPGYYYLHRTIPFYDANTGRLIFADEEKTELEAIAASVSHIVSADPATSIPGYSVEKTFDTIRILRRDADGLAILTWQEYVPTIPGGTFTKVMRQLYPDAPTPPPNAGIRFADTKTKINEQ